MDEILEPMERMAYEAALEICEMKQLEHREPAMATTEEVTDYIKKEMLKALRTLCRSGVMECHKTFNHVIMFKPKEPT